MRQLIYICFASVAIFAGCTMQHPTYPPPRVPVTAEPGVYIVQPGDTFTKIAMQFEIPVSQLERLNPDAKPYLKIGQKLHVPVVSTVRLIQPLTAFTNEGPLHVTGPYPDSPTLRRCLEYWTSNFSTNAVNHYYAGAIKPHGNEYPEAWIYWKEERTLIEYDGLTPDAPAGAEIEAFRGTWQLDHDTVDTPEEINGSTYLETLPVWVDWMEGCISHGREYVIPLTEARRLSPKTSP
jgi:LysM repeat protein